MMWHIMLSRGVMQHDRAHYLEEFLLNAEGANLVIEQMACCADIRQPIQVALCDGDPHSREAGRHRALCGAGNALHAAERPVPGALCHLL